MDGVKYWKRLINKKGGSNNSNNHKRLFGKIPISVMRSVYNDNPNYQFPQWVTDTYFNGKEDILKTVQIYYDGGESLTDVKELLLKREPFNVSMDRQYDFEKMKAILGWEIGAYQTIFDKNSGEKLPPNIAVYCKTIVNYEGIFYRVNCINLIGYGFDSPEQVDYQYFLKDIRSFKDNKDTELIEKYRKVWRKAFECAKQNNLETIYFAEVGGEAFGQFLPPNFYKSMIQPLVAEISVNYPNINVKWMKDNNIRIPDSFAKLDKTILEKSLFMNAWDPWSFVGNENSVYSSLDAFWGRSSCMAPQCWPGFNKFITNEKYIKIKRVTFSNNPPNVHEINLANV